MDTPDYMNQLTRVARDHKPEEDLNERGRELQRAWSDFEALVKGLAYDVLHVEHTAMRIQMANILRLLYRMPDADPAGDVEQIEYKNKQYGGSWHQRGGQGAFFMLCRKMDRINVALQGGPLGDCIRADARPEGILDDLGDLRRYLILCLAWHAAVADDGMPF